MREPLAANHREGLSVCGLALALLVGCGRNSGFLRDANTINEHQFRMNIAAQRYARSASGSSSIGSILCIVPVGNGAYQDAMAALHEEAKLQTNEVLENVREDDAFLTYIFYCQNNLIISADIYQMTPAGVAASDARQEAATDAPAPIPRPEPPSAPPPDSVTSSSNPCERAYSHVGVDLPDAFRAIYPNAKFVEVPAGPLAAASLRQAFLSTCAVQSEEVQICLQAPFLKGHADQCRLTLAELSSEKKTTALQDVPARVVATKSALTRRLHDLAQFGDGDPLTPMQHAVAV